MAGHSHWAGIKYKKAANDARRGKIWSKIARMIIVAAKNGGGDPGANLALRYAIDKAKAANMPKDTIEKAIKRGTGNLEGSSFEEVLYEGYGPSGVAIMVEALTDNRNRTAPEIKRIFEKRGGNMGEAGCVSWMFDRKSSFLVKGEGLDEERVMELVLEIEAEDYREEGDGFMILGAPTDFARIKKLLEERSDLSLERAEITMMPKNTVKLDLDKARSVLALLEMLDDHEDVQNCYANFEIPDELMDQI